MDLGLQQTESTDQILFYTTSAASANTCLYAGIDE
jgi:hypothetical protein